MRKQKCVKLCDVRLARNDLELLIKVHLAKVSLSEFVDDHYLWWIEENKSAALPNGYRQMWNRYLSPFQSTEDRTCTDRHGSSGNAVH